MGFEPDHLVRKEVKKEARQHVTTQKTGVKVPDISVNVKNLPSKGIAYADNAIIKYRPYTFGEIKWMNGSKMNQIDGYEFILKGIECSFDKYELTASDLLYLGFLRKVSTVGTSKFKFSYACQSCESVNTEILTLDNLEFVDIKAPRLPVTVDLSVGNFQFDALRIGRFLDFIQNEKELDTLTALAYSCLSHKVEEVKKLIEQCTLLDSEIIEEVDNYLDHGLKPLELVCKQEIQVKRSKTKKPCGFKNEVRVEGGDNLVQPFRESQESVKHSIRFG